MTVMLYGANGYTGRLIAERAASVGLRLILAGRRAEAIAQLAERWGCEHRVFALDSPADIAHHLDGVTTLLLAAGPFSATSAPALEACLMTRAHYLDITGEIPVFEHCFAQHARAEAAGVVVLPGVGFDVVPSDCLAASLAQALPGAHALELAFGSVGGGGPGISRGTARTMLDGIGNGGAMRKGGRIRGVPLGWRARNVPFPSGERMAVSIPWGDVSTAFHSTGIPDITVYAAASRRQIRAMRLARYIAWIGRLAPVKRAIAARIDRRVHGPDEAARATGRMQLWGCVSDASGTHVEGTLLTPESYRLTAETAVESARRVDSGAVHPGFRTPSLAFGAGYITEFAGCELTVGEPRIAG